MRGVRHVSVPAPFGPTCPLGAVVFATELPPNSSERPENPASATGSRRTILGLLKRRGGIRAPGIVCTAQRFSRPPN